MSQRNLIDGWGGPASTRIRLARPADTANITQLMAIAGTEISEGTIEAMNQGRCSAGVVEMLDGGLEVLARRLHTMVTASDENQEGELTTVLVAASRESEAVGAILALPPVHIVGSGIDQGADPDRMLVITASQIVKMCGLAVRESARGAGIGIALMRRAMQLYTQLGYQLMYGQFTSDRGLASYYRRLGYEVSPPGSALSLACVGLPEVRLAASPFEQIIAFDRATT